jgi:hypothetical protein
MVADALMQSWLLLELYLSFNPKHKRKNILDPNLVTVR